MRKLVLVEAKSDAQIALVAHLVDLYAGHLAPVTMNAVAKKISYLAFLNGKLIGSTALRPYNEYLVEQAHTVVLPEERGRGLGKLLSREAAVKAIVLGYKKIFCTVNRKNTKMLEIKKQQGFVCEGTLLNHYRPGRHIDILSFLV